MKPRKTPIRRKKLLTRKRALVRKSPPRRRSKKMAALMVEYMKLRKVYLAAHPICEVWLCELRSGNVFQSSLPPLSTDIHHKRGRGKYLLDTTTWMAVSRAAHRWIHDHPKESRERGYLL